MTKWQRVIRFGILIFGYPSADWPPGRDAVLEYDHDHGLISDTEYWRRMAKG
jgi:hypothetical protein